MSTYENETYLCPLTGAPRVVCVAVGEGAARRAASPSACAGLRAAVGAAVRACVGLRLGGVEEHLQRGDRVQLRRLLVHLACRMQKEGTEIEGQ